MIVLRGLTMRKIFGLNFHTGLLIGCAIAAAIAGAAVALRALRHQDA